MEALEVLDISREAIWVVIKISFPVMLIGMFFGLLMSFLQAITQIQEITLSFIPKMLAIFIAILLFMPYIGTTIFSFTEKVMHLIENQ